MSLVDIAYEWHGGQSSALYSFASTGGVVHSESHRADLEDEINRCWCLADDDMDRLDLDALELYVINAVIT